VSSERNNVEHFYPKANRETIRELLAEGCLLVREFIESALQEKPVDVLGSVCWKTLLEVSSVSDQERQACAAAIGEVTWDHELLGVLARECTCTDCGSAFMRPKETKAALHELVFVCRSCGSELVFVELLEELVAEHFRWEIHEAGKEGADSPVGRCPECGRETFIASEWTCVSCGHEPEESRCWRCHAALDMEELDLDGLCSWCEHMMNKND
jgi:DNA-directed RNA polymerase subunit M/transcription elongation factor TFIIS